MKFPAGATPAGAAVLSGAEMELVAPPLLLLALLALLASHGGTLALLVTAPYVRCVCPEGQNVTLSCRVSGPLADRHDLLYKTWYFSSAGDQSCSEKQHIRNLTERELHHEPGRHHGAAPNGTGRSPHGWQGGHRGVEFVPNHHGAFHIVVMNLTLQDSGNYCCYAMEVRREHGKPQTLQAAHGFVELQIQRGRGELQNCTFYTANSKDITAAALATGACIVGILCLPLILILIYKQRQAVSSRRAHELVRMESSSAQGIENPVFEALPAGSVEPRPRPQLSYLASRQPSESGRHLLSEPNTPLSPPGPGDCFFPTLDPVPDSPNSLKA
ncbi:V-type immunoglobulin domain-containing suppressor of T-cell activation-like isoform X1 [Oxyura jamaicensis]|uniref:V-type immunoglobulin domain-containing suppressor of T-cell activation-like isoform X1 n=1 Tax=Oxyura jamaicensis TaxID=8884 RepID=UPI0015A66418|nr:V-type immunoglobulin domain-containing suppressor of T-cell activation-like isoform X1 [Oxyura jamaicensis]